MKKEFKDEFNNPIPAPWEMYHGGNDLFALACDVASFPNGNCMTHLAFMATYPRKKRRNLNKDHDNAGDTGGDGRGDKAPA